MKKYACLIALLVCSFVHAQYRPDSLWNDITFRKGSLSFENVLLASYIDSGSVGNTNMGYFRNSYKFRDAYMPDHASGFAIHSEQYVTINQWKFYGSFKFSKYQESGTRYTEMANPYRLNPYKIMDSLSGDWNKQYYQLCANIEAPKIGAHTYAGLGISYEILNGARQKDPRPLDKTVNINLTPSMMYDVSNQMKIGIHGFYSHFMEDLSISLENTKRAQNVYKTLGLGEYLYNGPIIINTGLSRIYNGNTYGGGLSGRLQLSNKKTLDMSFSYKMNKEKATDGSSLPYNAGTHNFKSIDFKAIYYVQKERKNILWDLNIGYFTSSDTEYIQTLNSSTKLYDVIYASEMHKAKKAYLHLKYSNVLKDKKGAEKWNFKGDVDWEMLSEDYPSTQSSQRFSNALLNFGIKRFLNIESTIFSIQYNTSYQFNLDKSLVYYLNPSSSNFVALNILYPNYYFQTTNVWSNRLVVQYDFKKIHKTNSILYLKASFENRKPMSNSEYVGKGIGNNYCTFSVGIFN